MVTPKLSTRPPLVRVNRFPLPTLPANSRLGMYHKEPGSVITTSLPLETFPISQTPLRKVPPLVTTNRLPLPSAPMYNAVRLVQAEPAPVTRTTLLLLLASTPKLPTPFTTEPPLLTTN